MFDFVLKMLDFAAARRPTDPKINRDYVATIADVQRERPYWMPLCPQGKSTLGGLVAICIQLVNSVFKLMDFVVKR